MKPYEKTQRIVDTVIKEMTVIKELIGKTDESKIDKYGFLPGMNMKYEVELIDEGINSINEGIFSVVFISGLPAGKSTLINALAHKNLLRNSVFYHASFVTKLVFHAEEKVIVYKNSIDMTTGKQLVEELTVDNFFEKYRTSIEEPDKFSDVDYVQMQYVHDGIGGGLVQLVDLPCEWYYCRDVQLAVSRDFARKASAIVYVVNAAMPFTYDEKEYIKSHFAGRNMKNIFFVINRFDCVQTGEVDELKQHVEKQLREVFTKKDGSFDRDLFESRVFYTNAFGSLNTRTNKKTPICGVGEIMIPDENTGVPDFEDALGKFLTDDNRYRDALSAYIPKLAKIYVDAENKANAEINAHDNSLKKLKKEKAKVDADIEKTENLINNIFSEVIEDILRDIKTAYDTFLYMLDSAWNGYFGRTEFSNFSIADLIKLGFMKNEDEKTKLIVPIKEKVLSYLTEKTNELEKECTYILEKRINQLEKQLSSVYPSEILCPTVPFVSDGGLWMRSQKTYSPIKEIEFWLEEHLSLYLKIGIGAKSEKILNNTNELLLDEIKQFVMDKLNEFEKFIISEMKTRLNKECDSFISVVTEAESKYNEIIEQNIQDESVYLEKEKERIEKILYRLADSVSEINGAVLGDKLNVQDIKEMAAEYNCRMLMD